MNLLKTICNIKNRYASPFEMADDGIMGMNQRNVNFIGRYNKRNLFPLVDNKLLTKQIAMKNHVKTPVLLGSIQNQHEVSNVLNIIGEHTEFCIKPAHGSGGKGIAKTVVLSGSMMNILKIILLTAVRRGEAVNMRWIDIDGDKWAIPETKSGRPHLVTLSSLTMAIIDEQRAITSQLSPFVFESPSKLGKHVHQDAVTTALTRIRQKYMPDSEPFTVHDLRRSVATLVGPNSDNKCDSHGLA